MSGGDTLLFESRDLNATSKIPVYSSRMWVCYDGLRMVKYINLVNVILLIKIQWFEMLSKDLLIISLVSIRTMRMMRMLRILSLRK